jgi:hypothetical protein
MNDKCVRTGAEYALYWLAVKRPDIIEQAQRFTPAMLVSDPRAFGAAERLLNQHIEAQDDDQ